MTPRENNADTAPDWQVTEILDSVSDGFMAIDHDWQITFLNRKARELLAPLRSDPEQLLGKSVWEEFPELVDSDLHREYHRVMQERVPVEVEFYYERIAAWFEIRVVPASKGILIYYRDVTEEKRRVQQSELREQELRTAKNQLDIIFRTVADGINMQDRAGRIIYANDQAARDSGFASGEEMMAAGPGAIVGRFNLFDEAGHPFPIDQLPNRLALRGIQNPPEVLMRVRLKQTGQESWRVVNSRPVFDARGEAQYAITIWHDVTERMREDRNQRYLAQASDALGASLDYATTLRTVAQLSVPGIADWCTVDIVEDGGPTRQVALAHVDPAKVKWAEELRTRYPPDPNAPTGLPQVIRTGRPEFVPEISIESLSAGLDAEQLAILRELGLTGYMIVPLISRDRTLGAITFVSAESGRRFDQGDLQLALDLARRAALAVDNARLYREARQAIELRERFLSIASHELRTPVTVISGYTELLLRMIDRAAQQTAGPGPLDGERVQANLKKIEREVRRMEQLIGELLDVTRLQNDTLSLTRVRLDLAALVGRVVEDARRRQEQGLYPDNIDFRLSLPDKAGVWGAWDEGRMEQLLLNLIENAVKYSPAGGVVGLRLTSELIESIGASPTRMAHLVVQDHGIGIPRSEQGQLFNPFFRAFNASSRKYAGLGLGLSICRGIVQAHGGCIWAESDGEERGSTFHIILPITETVPRGLPVEA